MIQRTIDGFPGIIYVNDSRHKLFNDSHDKQLSALEKTGNWFGHKALTLISVPCNILGAGVGIAGLVATASTLGALKIFIFAVTLGNIVPKFPTGCLYFGERGMHSTGHIFLNMGELVYDGFDLLYQGSRVVNWISEKLYLSGHLKKIFEAVARFFEFIPERLDKGFQKAIASEGDVKLTGDTPTILRGLDDLTKENRIGTSEDRPLSKIIKHTVLSLVNIPANAVASVCAGVASVILCTAFIGKATIYATTNIDIPVKTFAGQALDMTYATARNAIVDTVNDVGDGFIVVYKTAEAIGVNKVMTTALGVLFYIPVALFG